MQHRDDDSFKDGEVPAEIRRKRDMLLRAQGQIRWCDDRGLLDENMADVAPGGCLNRFGWYVVGTTIGGNAIVVSEGDPEQAAAATGQ